MASTDPGTLIPRLERIRDLASDLAREMTRLHAHKDSALDVAAAIKRDIDAVIQILNQRR